MSAEVKPHTLNAALPDLASPTGWKTRLPLLGICCVYLILACVFGSMNLDIDEFGFVREPYELLGGDYTTNYLKAGQYGKAISTAAKAYRFYWKYRPLFSPIVTPDDQVTFLAQEKEFGYVKPLSVAKSDNRSQSKYEKRLIVPEPDRFYSHGAGKPLLSPILSIPQLAILRAATSSEKNLLYYQYRFDYHPIFILTRLVQILAGLATIVTVYWILSNECGIGAALLGCSIVALFPTCVRFFPNIHHDAIGVPFLIASTYCYYKGYYKRAGVCAGLALASKNVALVVIAPVFVIFSVMKIWESYLGDKGAGQKQTVRATGSGMVTCVLVAFFCLLPFANPISYAEEILTPLTHRLHDERGENVEQFTLSDRLKGHPESDPKSEPRSEWKLIQLLFRVDDTNFLFLGLSVALFWRYIRNQYAVMMYVMLLCMLPLGVLFGTSLNYRFLMFVPPFAILCAIVGSRRQLVYFLAFLLVVDLVYSIDPISSDHLHVRIGNQTFWGAVWDFAPQK